METKFNLFCNNLGDLGAAALVKAMEKNSMLTWLDSSGNNVGDLGDAALVRLSVLYANRLSHRKNVVSH